MSSREEEFQKLLINSNSSSGIWAFLRDNNNSINLDDPIIWKTMGNIFFKDNAYETALKCYENSIEIDHYYTDAINNLGMTYKILGRTNDAEKIFNYIKTIEPEQQTNQMQKWSQPRTQMFSIKIVFAFFLTILFSLFASYLIYLSPYDLIIIGSIVKGIIFGIFFYILFRGFKIWAWKYTSTMGLLSIIILFLFPFWLLYVDLINNGVQISNISIFFDWIVNNNSYNFFGVSRVYYSTTGSGSIYTVFYYLAQLIAYIIVFLLVIGLLSDKPFSTRYNKFYDKIFSKSYNIYEYEYSYSNFNTLIALLQRKDIFENFSKVQTVVVIVYGILDEINLIIAIQGIYYKLDEEQSKIVRNIIKQ